MKPERILLPLDVARCPLEVFELVNGFASRPEVTVILLHVLKTSRPAVPAASGESQRRQAQWYLEHLADQHLNPIASTLAHVRAGEPAEQIVAEARAENVDLIILPAYGPSLWSRLTALCRVTASAIVSPLVEHVIRQAACGVFVVLAKTRLNCEQAWGRLMSEQEGSAGSGAVLPLPRAGWRET